MRRGSREGGDVRKVAEERLRDLEKAEQKRNAGLPKAQEPYRVNGVSTANRYQVVESLYFFGDHVVSFEKGLGGGSAVVQYGDPDAGGSTNREEYVLWRASESGNYRKLVSELRKSVRAKLYSGTEISDVRTEFKACYVLRITRVTVGFRDASRSENGCLFASPAEVVGYLRERIGGELLREVLSKAAMKDVGFVGP